jgi:hypothetical protein
MGPTADDDDDDSFILRRRHEKQPGQQEAYGPMPKTLGCPAANARGCCCYLSQYFTQASFAQNARRESFTRDLALSEWKSSSRQATCY